MLNWPRVGLIVFFMPAVWQVYTVKPTLFLESLWDACDLALVLNLAEQIESQRIPESQGVAFSYRFNWEATGAKIFKDSTWIDFRKRCLDLANIHPIVVQTDIADFYPRIYHHRIDNALRRLPNPGDVPKRIMDLLGAFSNNVSYGIPVGGPASRILAELAINDVDKLLVTKGIKFCRYADDYAIFCSDKADAYRTLVFLAEKLANEGLVLQKKKTRILSSDEFRQTAQILDPAELTNRLATDEQKLLNISIRFDPYSPTAVEDYEDLKSAVSQIDIIGILGREVAKATVDAAVAKQAIQAIMALTTLQQEEAIKILLDPNNLMTLAPVFVTVMRVVRDVYPKCSQSFHDQLDEILCDMFSNQSPLLSVEVNLAYYLQALGGNRSQRKEEILFKLFENVANPLIRRLIILVMAKWDCYYWLSDAVKNKYGAMSLFERRAFLLASYDLGDEGKHWRNFIKPTLKDPEILILDWFAQRFQTGQGVPL